MNQTNRDAIRTSDPFEDSYDPCVLELLDRRRYDHCLVLSSAQKKLANRAMARIVSAARLEVDPYRQTERVGRKQSQDEPTCKGPPDHQFNGSLYRVRIKLFLRL